MNSDRPTAWTCPVTADSLVLLWPLFWKTGTWKPATVDTSKGLNTTNWTELSLVPCQLQKNLQGGLADAEDESDAKIFSVSGSERCPVKTPKNYLGHLNPTSDDLFQRPKDGQSMKFKPTDDKIWFRSEPLGRTTLDNMMKEMSKRAGIEPHLTNHCLRATSVTLPATIFARRGTSIHNGRKVRPGSWLLQRAAFDRTTTEEVNRSQWFHWKCAFWWCIFIAGEWKRSPAAVQTNSWRISTSAARGSSSYRKYFSASSASVSLHSGQGSFPQYFTTVV